MKTLVIAEKPSVARDIARVLKCSQNRQGAIEGDQYVVTWALGHLVTMADPEAYDAKYKEWKLSDLPMMPEHFKLVVIKQSSKQFNCVKQQILRKDIGDLVIATDAGREGELVARWILKMAGNRKPLKRLWISSVTDKAIREGFSNLKDGRQYQNLYEAAEARAQADWLVGMNGTRALTCKYNAQLSCGRVQTPTLALIAAREQQIKSFIPEKYYGMTCMSHGIRWTWQNQSNNSQRTFHKAKMNELEKSIRGQQLQITNVQIKQQKNYAPGLYDLTELQKDANQKYGYSAKETLNYMQRLYEQHKVLTYPRTDSRFISRDVADTLKERFSACAVGPYKKLAGALMMKQIKLDKRFVDDTKVSDHHAIIPTEQYVQLDKMSIEERRIYDLVVRRFLAVCYPPCETEQTKLTGKCAGEQWMASGSRIIEKGWKAVYENEQEEISEELTLPVLKEGMSADVKQLVITEGQTTPPALFTEGMLVKAMEQNNLGTVATRADIIDKLMNTFLMEKKEQYLIITSKGRQLLSLVPEELKKPELTAEWEKQLTAIAEGRLKREKFIQSISRYTETIVEEIEDSDHQFKHENLTRHACPQCGKKMLAVQGKNSRLLVCQDRECGYRETIARQTKARCPKCHKRMEMTGHGDGKMFICACGYKEKLSAFENRREKEGKGAANKRDVQKYLQKQRKEAAEPVNQAFAAAFAKLNIHTDDDTLSESK